MKRVGKLHGILFLTATIKVSGLSSDSLNVNVPLGKHRRGMPDEVTEAMPDVMMYDCNDCNVCLGSP
jgi:hypothetical protein